MTKGVITENLGEGLYRCEIHYDTTRLNDKLSQLIKQELELRSQLPIIQVELADAQAKVTAIADSIDSAIRSNPCYQKTWSGHEINPENKFVESCSLSYMTDEIAELSQASHDKITVEFKLKGLQSKRASLAIQINQLRSQIKVQTEDGSLRAAGRSLSWGEKSIFWGFQSPFGTGPFWCADYTTELKEGDQVGFALIPGALELSKQPVICPQEHEQLKGYERATHGVLSPTLGLSPEAAFYNAALFPGWQKWMPTFRDALILNIDHENDMCDIQIITNKSSIRRSTVGNFTPGASGHYYTEPVQSPEPEDIVVKQVPIVYMDCNAAPFEEGDRVLVRFKGNTIPSKSADAQAIGDSAWQAFNLEVVGFMEEPKDCHVCWFYFNWVYSTANFQRGPNYPELLHVTSSKDKFEAAGYKLDKWIFVEHGDRTEAGNIDWWGKNGVVLSWNGPPGRYFANEWMFPRELFSPIYFQGKAIAQYMYLLGACFTDYEETFTDEDGQDDIAIVRYLHAVHWIFEESAVVVTRSKFNVLNEFGDGYISDSVRIGSRSLPYWNWKWMCFFNASGTEGRFREGDQFVNLTITKNGATFSTGESVNEVSVNTRTLTWEATAIRQPTKPTPTFNGWAPVMNATVGRADVTVSARLGLKSLVAIDWVDDQEVKVEVATNERWTGDSYRVTTSTMYQHDDEPWNMNIKPCAYLRGLWHGAGTSATQEGVNQSYGYSFDMTFTGAISSTIGTTHAGSINTLTSSRVKPIPPPTYTTYSPEDLYGHTGGAEGRQSGLASFGLMYLDARSESFIAVARYNEARRRWITYPSATGEIYREASATPHRVIEARINGVPRVYTPDEDDIQWNADDHGGAIALYRSRGFGRHPDWEELEPQCHSYMSYTSPMPNVHSVASGVPSGFGPRVAASWKRFEYAFVYGPLITYKGRIGCTDNEDMKTDVIFHALSMPINKTIHSAPHFNPNHNAPIYIPEEKKWVNEARLSINGEEYPLTDSDLMFFTGRSGAPEDTEFRPLGLVGPRVFNHPPPKESDEDENGSDDHGK